MKIIIIIAFHVVNTLLDIVNIANESHDAENSLLFNAAVVVW